VVGNLTVGGTGKTPLVAWLAAQLQAHGKKVGLVSRGYGRGAATVRRVASGDSAALVGDEPAWLAANTGCAVAVGQDRVAALRLLAGEVDVVLADDGLQHHALPRRLEIIVIDATRAAPLGNGRCLPAGPLRERVRTFQVANGLQADGLAGPLTLMLLARTDEPGLLQDR
jgi:tetraacyldisaccharide 4'-kinase